MTITNGSDFILLLDISDIKGQPMRVADCASFQVRLYTDDPRYALVYSKRDILTDGPKDRIPIEAKQLEKLESGVLQYEYDYSIYNPDFTGTEVYQKVKNVVTDFYWQNRGNLENSENVVTWQIIKNLQDAIDACQVECGREMGALKHYIEVEYTNKLTDEIQRVEDKISDEIKRSNEVDIEFHKWLKELEQNLKNSGNDVTDIRNILEDLKSVDEYLQGQITANKEAIENIEIDNKKAFDDVNYRIDALKANTETIDKELDMRLDATERRLNNIQDSNANTPGSIENAVKRANQYTDNVFKDARNGLATEDELARVEAKIPVVPTNVSAFVNDMNYITDREIFNNFYKKQEVDEKHKAIADEIEDINTWAVRKDEATKVVDEEGNVIRELVIGSEPEYYTKEETDALLDGLDTELGDRIAQTNDRLSRLTVQHDTDIQNLDTKIDDNKAECEAGLNQTKEDLTALQNQHNNDVETLTNSISEAKSELNGKIETLESKVDADIQNLAENYYTEDEIDQMFDDSEKALNEAKTELNGKISAVDTKVDELEQKHDGDIQTVNASIESAKGELDGSISDAKSELQNNIDELSQKYDREIGEVNQNINSLSETVEDYKSELEKSIDNVDKKADGIKTELDGSISEAKSELQKEISDAKEEAKTYTDTLEEKHDREIGEVNQNITSLSETVENYKSELEKSIDNVDKKADGIKTELEGSISEAKSELQNNIKTVSDNLNENYYNKTEVDEKVKTLTDNSVQDKAELNGLITALESKVDADVNNLKDNYYTKTEIDKTVAGLNKTISDNKEEVEGKIESAKSELNQNIEEVDGKLTVLSGKVNSLEATVGSNKTDIENKLNQTKEELDGKIETTKSELQDSISDVDKKVDADIKNLADNYYNKTYINSLKTDIDAERLSLDKRVQKLEGIDHSTFATTENLNSAKSELTEALNSAKSELSGEISDVESKVDTLEQKHEADIETVNGNISSAKEELEQSISGLESTVGNNKSELDGKLSGLSDKVNSLEETVSSNKSDIESKLESAKSELETKIDNIDLSGYYTKEETYSSDEIDEKIKNVDVTKQLADYAKIWVGTKQQYEALGTYDNKTIYCFIG